MIASAEKRGPKKLAFDRKAISVVLCAFSPARWDDLRRAVDSLRRQRLQPAETIVVIDHCPELLGRARAEFPDAVVLASTGKPGLSGARNTGVTAARGDIVAFLDDDAFADAAWLEALSDAYADERVFGAGGHIEPKWAGGARPSWFPPEFDWVVGCTYAGATREPAPVRNMIGANMSFRRDGLIAAGGFRTDLGRVGKRPLGCEETEACIRMRHAMPDGVVMHVPDARVTHSVAASRGRWGYFLSRCWFEGISKAQLSGIAGQTDALSSEKRHAFRTLPLAFARALVRFRLGEAAALASGLAVTAAGYARGLLLPRPKASAPEPLDAGPRRPRLLVVTPRFSPLVGGVEHHVAETARRATAYADVTVLTTDTEGDLPAEEVRDGVRIVRVPARPPGRDWRWAPGVREVIADGGWDLVHVQSYHTFVAPLAMRAASRARIPFVLTFHGGGHSSRLRTLLRRPQWALLRRPSSRAARLIAVAEFEAESFSRRMRIPRERFVVIPNGSDLPAIPPVARDPHAIVSVGRLEQYKGHQRVIEAMPAVLAAMPGATLLILGSGQYREELERLAERLGVSSAVTIRSIPAEERAEMARALAGVSLLVLMSEFETHPLAVIEALSLGTPALVADTSGLAELAANGLARALPLDTPAAGLAEAILGDLRDPRPVPDLALPSWDECDEALRLVYEDVLRAPVPREVQTAPRAEAR